MTISSLTERRTAAAGLLPEIVDDLLRVRRSCLPVIGACRLLEYAAGLAEILAWVDTRDLPTTYGVQVEPHLDADVAVLGELDRRCTAVRVRLGPLRPCTTYRYQLFATNTAGTTPAIAQTFTTPGAIAPDPQEGGST